MNNIKEAVTKEEKVKDKCDDFDFVIEEEDNDMDNHNDFDADVPVLDLLERSKKTNKSKVQKPKKTSQNSREKKPNLTAENKIEILQHIKKHGASMKTLRDIIDNLKLPESLVLEYVRERMQIAQNEAAEECKSEHFKNANFWIKNFEDSKIADHSDFEVALAYHEIADFENHPDPAELDGVDLKKAYKFLANALEGKPQVPPDGPTGEFLKQQFDELKELCASEEAQVQTNIIKAMLKNEQKQKYTSKRSKISLDPLDFIPNIEENL